MIDIVMPFLSGTMEEGTIRRWLKQPGESVEFGDDLVEVEADKATVVYQSDESGILGEILAVEGATVPPGSVIARLLAPGENQNSVAVAEAVSTSMPATPAAPSPRATADLRGEFEEIALTAAERAMVRQVVASHATIPHFTMSVDVDLTRAMDALQRTRADGKVAAHPTLSDLMIQACATGLRAHPRVNSAFADSHIQTFTRVNIAFAVAIDDAVSTPVVLDADKQTLASIALKTTRLIELVRGGTVTNHDLEGATFTISNLGKDGPDSFSAVIPPPQVAILAIGRVRSVRWPEGVGRVATLTLSSDHRVLSGVHAAAFLATVRTQLETWPATPPEAARS
jgi:pyruvate dehydrogenase E2 component (dihydrolipoamide acetyltransferase)